MKRILVLTLALCVAMGLNAQIIQSDSEQIIVKDTVKPKKEKKERPPTAYTWYAKGGVAIMHIENVIGEREYLTESTNETKIGYDLKIGFQKPFNNKSFQPYWGAEAGLGTRGGHYYNSFEWASSDRKEFEELYAHSLILNPLLGTNIKMNNSDVILDIHAGFVLSCDISYTYNNKEVNYWYYNGKTSTYYHDNHDDLTVGINLGFTVWYKQFGADFTYQYLFGDDVFCHNIGIRLTYKF